MNYKKLILYFIILSTLLHLIVINLFPLLGDEAYYWQWSRHLDLSYYEQGPFLAIIIYIFTFFNKINNEFTVRLGAVLLFLFTMIFCILIYKKLYPKDKEQKGAFINLLFINSTFLYSTLAILMMHDTVMCFFYSVLIYIFLYIIENPERNKNWILAGIIYAAAIMSKFTILIIYPAIFLFLILNRNFKKYIKGFLIFSFVTLIFLIPVIIWNFNHNFAGIKYLFIRSGLEKSVSLKKFFSFSGGQILLLNPFLFFFFFIATIKKFKTKITIPELFLGISFIFPFATFLFLSFFIKIEANWPGFAYLPAFFLTTDYFIKNQNNFIKNYLTFTIISGLILCLSGYFLLPFYKNTPFFNSSNALSKSYGYKNIAENINNIYNEYIKYGPLFYAGRHYQLTSLMAFYLKGNPEVYVLIEHESSKNYRFWRNYKKLKNYNCLFLYTEEWESYEMEKFFEKNIKKIATLKESDKTVFIDFFTGYKGDL